jgi:mRNA interferase MazF
VILSPVSQADGAIKTWPTVILREIPPYKDFLVCGISS